MLKSFFTGSRRLGVFQLQLVQSKSTPSVCTSKHAHTVYSAGNDLPGNDLPGNNLSGNNLPGNDLPGNNLPGNIKNYGVQAEIFDWP